MDTKTIEAILTAIHEIANDLTKMLTIIVLLYELSHFIRDDK